MKKFEGTSDSELFSLWKNGSRDAELEFIERYRKHSHSLALELWRKFKNVTTVEVEDLENVGLFSLYVALTNFRKNYRNFYNFWRKIATHKMMDDVKDNSITIDESRLARRSFFSSYNDNYVGDRYIIENGIDSDKAFYMQRVYDIISDPKFDFPKNALKVFKLYLASFSLGEIASICNLSYSNVKRIITITKRKLKDILFNS